MTSILERDLVDPRPGPRPDPVGDGARPEHTTPRLRWAGQVLLIVIFYAAYSWVRGRFGSAAVAPERAFSNARAVMDLEARLGIGNELAVQQFFLQWPAAIRASNIFYGLFHFVVPISVLVALFRRSPTAYRRGRDTIVATTALGLIGFSIFPLMPPRLLCACPLGSGTESAFVDTLARFGGLWSFGSSGVGVVSNQYAAMPSLHVAWALWSALTLLPLLRGRWSRAITVAYPLVTVLVVVITANHFWLDVVGGAAVLGAGAAVVALLSRLSTRRRAGLIAGSGSRASAEDSRPLIACPGTEGVR